MAISYARLWVHALWGTNAVQKTILPEFKAQLYRHIKVQLDDIDCPAEAIGGTEDHIHILLSLSRDKSIAELTQLIKGESSHWLNRSGLAKQKFAWQAGYSAFTVSHSQIAKVKQFIQEQEKYHNSKTYEQELKLLLKSHKIPIIEEN